MAKRIDERFISIRNNKYLTGQKADGTDANIVKINSSNVPEFEVNPQVGGSALQTEAQVDTKLATKISSSEKGQINGVASLDSNGLVPSAQLPSYVDDILEYDAVKASVVIQDLTHTADAKGTSGNNISLTYVNPAVASAALSISVTGSAITVNLATNASSALISTASDIKAALDAHAGASALIDVTISGLGTNVQAAQAQTFLAGGKTGLQNFPTTGTAGKIYVALDTGKLYRWSGSTYVEVSSNDVNSVNGKVGVVVLGTGDISESGSNLYHTDTRALSASVLSGAINGAETAKAPTHSAVSTALSGKANTSHTHVAADITDFSAAAKAAAVADSITDGILDVAPSQNAVADALALKANQTALNQEISDRQAADNALDARIDTLETKAAVVPRKYKVPALDMAAVVTNGYVDLPHSVQTDSLMAFVGRLALHEGASDDYTLSVVGGVTRVTFINSIIPPGKEALESTDQLFFYYNA